jgi:adenine-specific DNA methylase
MTGRSQIQPIIEAIPAERQAAARHYGVHPYFTRRPANVVRAYVEHYSHVGDVVLDPFGGTGVTAIESLLAGRRAVHNDLNPFANFITANIADTSLSSTAPLRQAFARIEAACASRVTEIEQADEATVGKHLRTVPLPVNIGLPRNSDAEHFHDLFTPRQLAGLATLKQAIDAETDERVRKPLLLAWSASVAKLNKTFLSAEGRAESRGGSSIFSIYRYKLAKRVIELPLWETFRGRFINVLAAKAEVLQLCEHFNRTHPARFHVDSRTHLRVLAQDAAALSEALGPRSMDYIFTDPPYGAHIAYLDLSILWNHWLGFPVTDKTRAAEAIVGGECGLSEDHYKRKLADSIRECFRLLKPDRWLSVVFQHWDTSYFATILETARDHGGLLKAAVTQERDVIWSMHKKKNSENVLSGEMILTFHKPAARVPAAPRKTTGAVSFERVLDAVLERPTGASGAFTSEFLFNQVILEAWQRDGLSALAVKREGFAAHLRSRGWNYDPKANLWSQSVAAPAGDLLFALHETPATYTAAVPPLPKSKPPRGSNRRGGAKTTA